MKVSLPLGSILIASLIPSLVSCDSIALWRQRAAVATAVEAVQAASEKLELAQVTQGAENPKGHPLTIVVNPGSVLVTNGPWLESLDDATLSALASDGDFTVLAKDIKPGDDAAIIEALKKAIAIQEKINGHYQSMALLRIDKRLALEDVDAIMQSAWAAGLKRLYLTVMIPQGERFIMPAASPDCAPTQAVSKSKDAKAVVGYCAVPEIQPVEGGYMVRTREVAAGQLCVDAGEEKAEPSKWDGQVMVAHKGECPSVLNSDSDGENNLKGLVKLLKEVSAIAPACIGATIHGSPDTTWEQAAPAFVATSAHSPFSSVSFSISAETEPGQCMNGIRPRSLPKVAEKLVKDKRAVDRVSIMGHLDDME